MENVHHYKNNAVANQPTVGQLVHGLTGRQVWPPATHQTSLPSVHPYHNHTIHTLTLTLILTLSLTLTLNLTLISNYLTNKHQYAQPNMSAN